MKSIEDIGKMSLEELEKVSQDASIKVPEGLSGRLEALLGASEIAKETAKPRPVWLRYAVAAAAAALLAVAVRLSVPGEPEDSFSDPLLAYAQVEQVFERISFEGGKAAHIAGTAAPVIEKTEQIFNTVVK